MSRIAILGGKGMLGSDISELLTKENIGFEVFDLPEFDITSASQLRDVVSRSDMIINCAAYTNVEKAEDEPEFAYKINAEALEHLGDFAGEFGKWVLHFSTDFVFDGSSDQPYSESDLANPINVYGKSKLAGEEALLESGCDCCIVRIEWTYGRNGTNFIKKLLEFAQKRDELKVVDDQVGSPTATTEIAKVVRDMIDKKPTGLYHFANLGYVSRYEMARFVFEYLNMPVRVIPCKSSEFKTKAQRPLNSRFNCDKIAGLIGGPIADWQGPLKSYLESL